MRVNHCGEICAQALYQGQALTARNPAARAALEQAAAEETDHLAWTAQRIGELGGRVSLLNPLWYAGSFALGAAAGLLGDKWSLGFLAETERQVEGHLEGHLDRLPPQDAKSRAIIDQMKADEARHARAAVEHGAAELPEPVKSAMKLGSRVMTRTAFWI
jgi:ubiquinone biosynthesis monooxygenase Coq7